MAITIWPANASNGVPAVAGRGLRQTSVGVPLAGATAARPLGVRSGVRPGTPTTTVSIVNRVVNVAPHAGVIDGQTAAEAGGYEYSSDSVVPVQTNLTQDASNPRVDLVSVQVSDPSESDGTSFAQVQFVYTQGTAAASPLAPGDSGSSVAAPARSFALARINVPKSGGGNPTVSWVAPYLVAAGGVMPIDTLANLRLLQGTPGQFATVFADPTTFNNGLYQWNSATARWDTASSPTQLMNWATSNGGTAWAPVTGFQPLVQMGQFQGQLTSGAIANVTLPTPFPNGFSFAWLSPHRDSGTDTAAPPLMQQTGASKTGFQFFVPNRAGQTVFIPWVAFGW